MLEEKIYKSHELGKYGEEKALEYLKKIGYIILDKNFSCKLGEIDIIALDKKEIVFIEVKTRSSKEYGMPSEAVTKYKLKHIYNAAQFYLNIRNLNEEYTRIDVIEVLKDNGISRLNHIKQVV